MLPEHRSSSILFTTYESFKSTDVVVKELQRLVALTLADEYHSFSNNSSAK